MSIFLGTINLLSNWVPMLEKPYMQIIGIFISQLIYLFLKKNFSIEKFLSEKNKEKLCFEILCYYFRGNYNKNYEKILSQLLD